MNRHAQHIAICFTLAACALLAGSVSVANDEPLRTITPQQVGAGELLWKSEHGLVPLPIVDLEVDLEVTGIMLHGRVAQTFRNPTEGTIEVVYAFPLPDRAAVHHMEMQIGDRRIVSEVQEKRQAQRTYEAAKAAGRTAALVQQDFGSLFTTKAANIDPGATIVVLLEYVEEVLWTGDAFELRFPLTYVPRFTPPPARLSTEAVQASRSAPGASGNRIDAQQRSAAGSVPAVTVRVALDAGLALASVTSGSHAIDAVVRDASARIVTVPGRVAADRDFRLRWEPVRKSEPEARVLIEEGEERDDGRFGLVMVMPPTATGEVGLGLPTETLFIIDVSGSMNGPPLRQAREALLAALDRLRPEDRFNIIKFSSTHTSFSSGLVHAEGADLAAARRWVGGLQSGGGTMILPALVAGMEMLGRSRSAHAQRIVFLTDGAVSNETQLLDAVARGLGDTRLHTIGIGHAPNTWLMRKMAWHGRGLCAFISDVSAARNGIDAFFGRLERPVLTDVELEWDGVAAVDVLPARIPDLYAGEPLYLSFRLADDEGPLRQPNVKIGGYSRAGRLERTAPLVVEAASGSGLALRWARARVGALMDSLHEGADPDFVRGEVVEVALEHNLVTLYTSLVAVDHGQDDSPVAGAKRVAALLPQGGTDAGLRWLVGCMLLLTGFLYLWLFARPS